MQAKVRNILFLVAVLTQVQCHKLTLKAGDCTWGRKYLSNFSFYITNNAINVDIWIIKTIRQGLLGHIDFEMRVANAEHFQPIFKHDLNYCNLIANVKNPLYQRWFRSILDKSNFSTSCPISESYYYLHNWAINEDLIPMIFVAGTYRVVGSLFFGKYKSERNDYMLKCVIDGILK